MKKNDIVFLVDDHPVLRNGLKELIEKIGDYNVSRQFDNGQDLIDAIPFEEEPDLIIMDNNMPVMDGIETMKWFKKNNINHKVLMLTIDASDASIIELFKMGVRGYQLKSCTAAELKKSMDDVINTGYYHNELLSRAVFNNHKANEWKEERAAILKELTDKEMKFLLYVCDEREYTYEDIAAKMQVHRRTVDGYRENLFNKFNIKSKTGLVLFAIRYKLLQEAADE